MICRVCKLDKEESLFKGNIKKIGHTCIDCYNAYYREWRKNRSDAQKSAAANNKKVYQSNNKEAYRKNAMKTYYKNKKKLDSINEELIKQNKTPLPTKQKTYYANNKKMFSDYKKEYILKKKESDPLFNVECRKHLMPIGRLKSCCCRKCQREKYNNLPEEVKEYRRQKSRTYYNNNRDKCLEVGRNNKNKRIKSDPVFKLKSLMSSIMYRAFNNGGYSKKSKTHQIIGIDFDRLKIYIERQFKKGMTWDNYGKKGWHIDHKIPLASANTEEDLLRLCHYTNLQPLWEKDNLIKSKRIFPFQTNMGI